MWRALPRGSVSWRQTTSIGDNDESTGDFRKSCFDGLLGGEATGPQWGSIPGGVIQWNTNEWYLQELCSTVATGNQIGKRNRRWGNGGSEYGQRHTTMGREEYALWSLMSQSLCKRGLSNWGFLSWKLRSLEMQELWHGEYLCSTQSSHSGTYGLRFPSSLFVSYTINVLFLAFSPPSFPSVIWKNVSCLFCLWLA